MNINELNNDSDFKDCIFFTDTQNEERYDLEMIVRYIVYNTFNSDFLITLNKSRNMDIFLTEELEKIAKSDDFSMEINKKIFSRIFVLLKNSLGENALKRYKNDKFIGLLY